MVEIEGQLGNVKCSQCICISKIRHRSTNSTTISSRMCAHALAYVTSLPCSISGDAALHVDLPHARLLLSATYLLCPSCLASCQIIVPEVLGHLLFSLRRSMQRLQVCTILRLQTRTILPQSITTLRQVTCTHLSPLQEETPIPPERMGNIRRVTVHLDGRGPCRVLYYLEAIDPTKRR